MTTHDETHGTTPSLPPVRHVRLTCEADVLAYVPTALGFVPHDSLVVMSTGRLPMTARVDLVPDRDVRRELMAQVVEGAVVNGIRAVLAVAYTDDALLAADGVDDLADLLGEHDALVVHSFRADGERWFTLLPQDETWGQGTPYDVEVHPLTAAAVLEGRVVHADRAALVATLDPADPDHVEEVEEALDLLEDDDPMPPPGSPHLDRRQLRREAEWAAAWVRDRTQHVVEVPSLPSAEEVARVLRVLAHDEAREVVLAEVTRETATLQVELWRTLARLAPDDVRAPVSALLAFAAWQQGNGALAWCAVDRARWSDPDDALAAVVADALRSATPPTAWAGVDRASLRLLSA